MECTFEITHDREFLKHFLTRWRTLSISPEMVERLRAASNDDPYAAYGYGRWLSLANPGGDKLKKAEILLTWAGTTGNVQDANAALAELYYDGRTEADKAMPGMHAFMMDSSYKLGSELAQFEMLEHTIYGEYGFPKNPAEVADILRGHIEKNPDCDPIYYGLWGEALEKAGLDGAEKAYQTAISRGETEAYYSLASLYKKNGQMERSYEIAREGARHGAVNCRRFRAGMDQEDFLALSESEQRAFHEEIESGLNYAIEHNDRVACFQKGAALSLGELGFKVDFGEAMKVLRRGGELGDGGCYSLIAAIQADEADTLPAELKLSDAECAKINLMSVRLRDGNDACLETVVKAYVSGLIPQYNEEIEKIWLKEYQANVESADDEEGDDQFGVLAVYPQGFYYAMDVEPNDDGTLDLEELATKTGANRYDIVHYSPLLNRLTKVVPFADSFHIAMLVDRDGYAKGLPDNMPATIIYGQGNEILGPVVFVLEHNDDYSIVPMNGIRKVNAFLQMLKAATGNIIRQPSNAEMRALGEEVEDDEEEDDDQFGVLAIYPQGFYYAMDVEPNDDGTLDLEELATKTGANRFDVVHYSPILTRLTKAVPFADSFHIAMLVDRDGYAKGLPDNMPATIIYGQGTEILGPVIFVLEHDDDYSIVPMTGIQKIYDFLQMLKAETGNIIREPSNAEMRALGEEVEDDEEDDEYDDRDFYDDPDELEGYEKEQEVEENMASADTSVDAEEPKEVTTTVDGLNEALQQCNLCRDTLFVLVSDDSRFAFMSTDDIFYTLGIMGDIEENIERHGGYMIDEWQYVDERQIPMDIRSRVRFK